MFRLFASITQPTPHAGLADKKTNPSDEKLFKQCIKKPIIDNSYEGPNTLNSDNYCNSKFENTVPLDVRCQSIFNKCRKTPIYATDPMSGGEKLNNLSTCEWAWERCISGKSI